MEQKRKDLAIAPETSREEGDQGKDFGKDLGAVTEKVLSRILANWAPDGNSHQNIPEITCKTCSNLVSSLVPS